MQSYPTQRLAGYKQHAAAVIADPTIEIGMLIKEILRSLDVQPTIISPDPRDTIRAIDNFQADLIVIDDAAKQSAVQIIRRFIASPACLLTPIVILTADTGRPDHLSLGSFCRPMLISKPLSPGRFATGFKTLIKVWSDQNFKEVVDAMRLFGHRKNQEAMQVLIKLSAQPRMQPIVAPAISALLRSSGNIKVAEKVLLAALKVSPRDVGVVTALTDLYIRHAMPATALRLIRSYESVQGANQITGVDALQAHLMLNETEAAIERLLSIGEQALPNAKSLLARLYYTEGRNSEFESAIGSKERAQRIALEWNPTNRAAAS